MSDPDPRAQQVANAVQLGENPDFTILFGSRARGDHREGHSDIDIMLVQETLPSPESMQQAIDRAEREASNLYGTPVAVQLAWRTREEFRHNRRFSNSIETTAVREGTLMYPEGEEYSHRNFEDEDTEFDYDWSPYSEHLRHAEEHLQAFQGVDDLGLSDTVIGQQAQNTLEFALKALLEAHEASYQATHNIAHLLGNVRRSDPELREFTLSIPPDVYTAYEGDLQYRRRQQPRLTDFRDYRHRTTADAAIIIQRARQVRSQPHT